MCLETIADENWLTEFLAKIDDITTVRLKTMADENWLTGPFCKTQHYYQGVFSEVGFQSMEMQRLGKYENRICSLDPECV
jgi:hypothetical protein